MRGFFLRTGGLVAALIALASPRTEAQTADFVTNEAGQGAKRLKVINSTTFFHITSFNYIDLTSTTIDIPAGIHQARIVARFSGESNCQGLGGSYCILRILVDGVEINPVGPPGGYAFDSSGDRWSGNALERTSNVLLPGTHTVTVQGALGQFATSWFLDDWQLSLEVWKVS